MARRKKPPALGLHVSVLHPATMERRDRFRNDPESAYSPEEIDADGHMIDYEVSPWGGQELLNLSIRRGMSPVAASALLRKLADLIDRHGELLNARQGVMGNFTRDGDAERSPHSLDDLYDDFGDIPNLPKPE
jgi:hypothetical protein